MAERATIFGSDAAVYDAVRPTYPPAVIDRIVAGAPDLVIEVGCGTGIASALVAARGVRVVAVEPDERMAQLARARGIQVTISSLEEWPTQPCDVMFAAQSWHWVDPTRGARVAQASIRPGGRWIAFWNHVSDPAIDNVLHTVFRRLAPSLLEDQAVVHAGNDEFRQRIASGLAATSAFEEMATEQVEWIDQVDSTRFIDRLGSHSNNRLLPAVDRRRVRDALIEALGDRTDLQVRYRHRGVHRHQANVRRRLFLEDAIAREAGHACLITPMPGRSERTTSPRSSSPSFQNLNRPLCGPRKPR